MYCLDVYKCKICARQEYRPHKITISMPFMNKCPLCGGDIVKVDTIFQLNTDKKL